MAENENEQTTEQDAAAQKTGEQEGPNFAVQRIYLKDASFESPGSPGTFQGQWTPKITFDIKSRSSKIQDDVYEVVLVLTVEAKQDETVSFLVEVQQGAVFTCRGIEDQQLEQVLATVCPNIIFPYAREAIDAMVVKGSFPPLMLAPVNFDALYAQRKSQEAQQAADNGNGGN
ncbi:MAG: protein-export chaperone SecB, partial [Gammaproteobacteria bacterium]|nr:protein-export chaperone SecB [Gammaproteobacteria bacterium]